MNTANPSPILVSDTGPLVAYANSNDTYHFESLELFDEYPGHVVIPSLVATEVCYLLQKRVGVDAEIAFIRSIVDGAITVLELEEADWRRVLELCQQYKSLALGVVDASVIAIAERLKVSDIATINGRDFRAVRPKHIDSFRLLPLDA